METGTNSKNFLMQIVERRREAIAHRKRVLPEVALKLAVEKKTPPTRDIAAALSRPGLNIIAELKKASSSRGLLRADYHPAELAQGLEAAGAVALSVLTEEESFQGSLADLKGVSKVIKIPILRKDFIIDPWQVWETRAAGADAFLLIVAILDDVAMRDLLELGRKLKMEALVEVHSREELRRATGEGARIVGVNNRDLRTFEVKLETSLELVESIPNECIAISESGIRTHADIEQLHAAGFDAFLVGEHLMTMPEPEAGLRELLTGESVIGPDEA
ncbi:MAG TPA: indole-3-glycerol phosphate synthase TrpC [Candidatus Acidoferrales bacterium]|nr:indole-3-glycerol phosphate synthase TrpC [Candidatus Acidoferrales bacterium]